jgi:peroxiredoxin
MRKITLALVSCLVSSVALAAGVGEKIPRFEAQLQRGAKTSALDSHRTRRPTVYLTVGTRCPTTTAYVSRLRELEQRHAGKVDFVYVYPNKTDSSAEKTAFHAAKQLAGALVDDQQARIASLLGAQRTAEVFLVDRGHRLVYHGAIDDDRGGQRVSRRHLAIALDELLAGKKVSEPKTAVQA